MGQIQAKGKLSAEEMLQMAERGLPVFDVLKDKLGLTKKDMENLGAAGIESSQAINAILEGLDEKFNGAAKRNMNTLA